MEEAGVKGPPLSQQMVRKMAIMEAMRAVLDLYRFDDVDARTVSRALAVIHALQAYDGGDTGRSWTP